MKIDGVVLADAFANKTFLLLEVKTVLINICDQRNCLREVYMDGFIRRYVLIVWIRDLDRTVFYTSLTTRAFVLDDVSGLCNQGGLKFSWFPVYTLNFSICQNLYVGMPADLDQFGREYSHRAVIGGKGLVKLGHMAANAGSLLNQINLIT